MRPLYNWVDEHAWHLVWRCWWRLCVLGCRDHQKASQMLRPRSRLKLALVLHFLVLPESADGANTTASWLARRAALIDDVYGLGTGVLPRRAVPDAVETYGKGGPPGLRGLVWNMSGMFEITSTVFFSPKSMDPDKRTKSAFFYHHGHENCDCKPEPPLPAVSAAKCRPGCASKMPTGSEVKDRGYTWWDLDNVSHFFHSLGHDVFIFSMPLKGVNVGPGSNATFLNSDHCMHAHPTLMRPAATLEAQRIHSIPHLSRKQGGSSSGSRRATTRSATFSSRSSSPPTMQRRLDTRRSTWLG